jgi:hypothetical protein
MKKTLIFLTSVIFFTSCTLTIGDTHNCDGKCCGENKECELTKDSVSVIEEVPELPNSPEYEIIEE